MTRVEEPPEREFWIPCQTCGRRTCHRSLTLARDHANTGSIEYWDDYFTLQCQGCKTVTFAHESKSSDNVEWNPVDQEEQLAITQRLYPPRVAGLREIDRWFLLPANIRTVYQETLHAINSSSPILAGIGIRAIVETVCKHEKAKGRNLELKINNLKDNNVVTQTGADVLHSLRFMGNAAAHEVRAHSQEELTIALEVVENLLRGVYIIPRRAKKLLPKRP